MEPALNPLPGPRLVAAKTRVPQPPAGWLPRPRLLTDLQAGLERKLLVVIAPAGFGKTTLLAEGARTLGTTAAWLTLDPSDQDLAVFTTYLVAAIAARRPAFGRAVLAWLAATPYPAAHASEGATILLDELEALDDAPLVLFLDDFHEVSSSDSILQFLDYLLRYLPASIHLVLSTRTLPALTTTRLLAQQQIGGLGTDDLRFTTGEAERWVLGQAGVADHAAAAQLVAQTEGWVTGMILQAAAPHALPPGGTGTQVYAYLSAEVLERQPPAVQQFLQQAAILPHLNEALCRAVLDTPDAAVLLAHLHDQQLFLTAVGTGPAPAYRFHPLFREFLLAQVQARDPATYTRLHGRTAQYFEQQGEVGQAMEHRLAAGDWTAAAILATRVGHAEIGAGRVESVARWLTRFPPAELIAHPALLLLEARLLAAQGRYSDAAAALDRAEHPGLAQNDPALYAELLGQRAVLAAAPGDGHQMIALAHQALAIPSARPSVQAQAQHTAGIGYAIIGDIAGAEAAFTTASNAYTVLGDLQSRAYVNADWGYALVLRQEAGRAVMQLETALAYARQVGNSRLQARVLDSLANLHHLRGEVPQAATYLAQALDLAQQFHWRRLEAEILAGQAELAIELDGPAAALARYEATSELAHQVAPATFVAVLVGQARCSRYLGRDGAARRLAQQAWEIAQAAQMSFEVALTQLEWGAAQLSATPDLALPLLQEAEAALVRLDRPREAARAAVVVATALQGRADSDGAGQALARAYAATEARGQHSYLAPELATLGGLPLLRQLARQDGRFASWLAATTAYLTATAPPPSAEPLAARPPLYLVPARLPLIEVYSLGQATVYRDGLALARADWHTATAKELFFYFVEHPAGERKEVILAALWPDQSHTRANETFHTSLRRLRAPLGPDVVQVDDTLYRLNPALALWHDGAAALDRITRAQTAGDGPVAQREWRAAADLLAGPFAEEFYRDWAGARRQYWETQTRLVLNWLAHDALAQHDMAALNAWAQRLLALDGLDEAAHSLLMQGYAAAGQPVLLTRQYQELCRLLQYELGTTPSPATHTLYARLLEETNSRARSS